MAKLQRGRLDGLDGMASFTAEELFALADKLEREMQKPSFSEDPKWQQRWINKIRKLGEKKEKAIEHKRRQ